MDIKIANDFYKQFSSNHVILYVGRNLDNSELEIIAHCPWSAIITSREDKDFFTFFPNARKLCEQGFLCVNSGRVTVPVSQIYVINSILCELLTFE